MASKEDENIIVVVRCRPFSEKEKQAGHTKICKIDPHTGTVSLANPKNIDGDVKNFSFDASFDEDCTQMEVYNRTARRIVEAVLEGFNGTVFAYGQTGTGKTFSMQGITNNEELRGIIPNAFHHIFNHIGQQPKQKTFLVRVSFLEIYNEDVRDLLIPKQKSNNAKPVPLEIKEDPEKGVYVKNLTSFTVKSVFEMETFMDIGNENRSVGSTLMNATSSRSHSIFSITVETAEIVDGEERFRVGKLSLVDLAGSERQSKTGASGDRLKEATKINLSLSALGNCISALVDGKASHIPYRDSKLTRLLQDSLGGNSKTLMIATMSPASYNFDESLSSLRYANRAKNIKNKPKINEDPKDALLREYSDEIARLKAQLEAKMTGVAVPGGGVIKRVVKKILIKKVVKKKKKVRRSSVDGIVDGDDESEDEEGDEEDDDEIEDLTELQSPLASLDQETINRLQSEVEAEKKALLLSKDMVIEEKQKIASELEKRSLEIETERNAREEMTREMQALEDKLLVGGVNIFDHVNAQQKELEETQIKLQERAEKEHLLKQQLDQKQELQLQKEENYASLQDEVDSKSKKLKKLWQKLSLAKQEITDLNDEFRTEREDLLDTIRELSKELSLKLTILVNFVPKEDYEKIEQRAVYDEETEEWVSMPLDAVAVEIIRPFSTKSLHRPTCQYAKTMMTLGDPRFRYRGENLLSLKLHMPDRTTIETDTTDLSSKDIGLKGALDYALGDDSDEIFVSERDLMIASQSNNKLSSRSKSRGRI